MPLATLLAQRLALDCSRALNLTLTLSGLSTRDSTTLLRDSVSDIARERIRKREEVCRVRIRVRRTS